jgi:hypothetical protein
MADFLKQAFPSFDEGVLNMVLESVGHNMDRAVEALISMCDTSTTTPTATTTTTTPTSLPKSAARTSGHPVLIHWNQNFHSTETVFVTSESSTFNEVSFCTQPGSLDLLTIGG